MNTVSIADIKAALLYCRGDVVGAAARCAKGPVSSDDWNLVHWRNAKAEWVKFLNTVPRLGEMQGPLNEMFRKKEDFVLFQDREREPLVLLRAAHFSTLAPGEWLGDEVMNAYIWNLCQTNNHLSLLSLYLAGGGELLDKPTITPKRGQLVLAPVNVRGVHWCFLWADLDKETIYWADSMGGSNMGAMRLAAKFMHLAAKFINTDTEWKMKVVIPRGIQEDGHNCGVYVCRFARELVENGKLDLVTLSEEELNRERALIAYTLYSARKT